MRVTGRDEKLPLGLRKLNILFGRRESHLHLS